MNKHLQVKMAPEGAPASAGGEVPSQGSLGSAAPASSPQEVNWGSMVDDSLPDNPPLDEEEAEPAPPPSSPNAQEQGEPAAIPPQEPPAAQPEGTQPASPTPQELQAQAQALREQMGTELAGIYERELTDEDRSALLTDPASVMPKMLAKAVMDARAIWQRELAQELPALIARHTQAATSTKEAWGEFDRLHPDLAKPEYRKVVLNAINTVKATGRKLDKQNAMAAVARTARAILDLPTPGSPAPQVPETSAAPVAPFNPTARGHSAPRAPKKPAAENPWEQFLD